MIDEDKRVSFVEWTSIRRIPAVKSNGGFSPGDGWFYVIGIITAAAVAIIVLIWIHFEPKLRNIGHVMPPSNDFMCLKIKIAQKNKMRGPFVHNKCYCCL